MDAATTLRQALESLEGGKPEEAAESLRRQVERDPSDALACAALGVVLLQLDDCAAAVDSLERAHYLQPGDAQILYNYGAALERAGRVADARLRFEAVLRLDPSNAPARARLDALAAGEDRGGRPAPPSVPPASTSIRRAAPPPPRERTRPPAPRAAGFARRAPVDPPEWEPDPPPGFGALARAAAQLWAQQPLLWLAILAVPNCAAAILGPRAPELRWAAVLCWVGALGLGTAPLLAAMRDHWVKGMPLRRGGLAPRRLLTGLSVSLPYALLTLGPFCATLALRSRFSIAVLLLSGLFSTIPFHALLAPGLVAAADGRRGWDALRGALTLTGSRTWMHLLLMLVLGGTAAGLCALYGWAYSVTVRTVGETVSQVLQLAAITVGESFWAAMVTVCGLDALAVGERPAVTTGRRSPP